MKFDLQSIKELEFDQVRLLLADFCNSEKAKTNCKKLDGFKDLEALKSEFAILAEIKRIYEEGIDKIPHPRFENIQGAIKILRVENGVLTLDELIKVYDLCLGTLRLIHFANKHKEKYPLIYKACAHIERVSEITKPIQQILNEQNQIKDDASEKLFQIRNTLRANHQDIKKNFDQVLRKYKKDQVIGEIEETFLEGRRLLSVLSQYKKRVRGKVFGTSSSGVLTYIEPYENAELNKQQEKLKVDEHNEVFNILKEITLKLRSEKSYLAAYDRLLVRFDLLNAKVQFSEIYNGIIPKITDEKKMYWQNAIHPLLYLANNQLDLETIGQTFELEPSHRFLVISGPNAGGKSITLKTVGLLQLMFQSGLFVPVEETSSFCWFNKILSDIGDNQSIENQLSTYSYRLKRMNEFLDKSDNSTLLLLDEFGSGSDPELGGALAEVIYEELYNSEVFAVVTTHYTNIKILTAALKEAVNGCMLFDTRELRPLYQLSVGQPGSSFTFEVARLNGMAEQLIDLAKQKVSESKVKLDALAVSLQKEKSKLKKFNTKYFQSSLEADRTTEFYEKQLDKLTDQAERQRVYFEQQNKFINAGKKLYELIGKHKKDKNNRALFVALQKFATIEKVKTLTAEDPVVLKTVRPADLPKPKNKKNQESEPDVSEVIEEVKEVSEKPRKNLADLKSGDKVKLKNQTGFVEIVEIKGKKVKVIVGNMTVSTTLDKIEV